MCEPAGLFKFVCLVFGTEFVFVEGSRQTSRATVSLVGLCFIFG